MSIEPTGTSQNLTSGRDNLPAVGFMLVSTLAFSLQPLTVNLTSGYQTPFLFNAIFRVGVAAGDLLFLLIFYRGTLLDRRVLPLVVQHVQSWPMIWMLISTLEFALFIWSVKFIDIAVAAILYETWPVLLIFLTAWLFRKEVRYRRITLTKWLLVLLSMAGFSFALASQTADFGSLEDIFSDGSYVGAILAILSTIAWSLTAFSFRWGSNLSREVTRSAGQRKTDYLSLELCFVIVGIFIVSLLAEAVSSGIGLARGEFLNLSQTPVKTFIWEALLLGFAAAGGSIAWRRANIYTTNLGINALAYATPVLSLIWLFSLGQADVTRVDYLVIGAAAIITANLLINFETDTRYVRGKTNH